ncbi:MAG: hypothetical protein JW929_01295 [Anaerolineales bacterium]|nr:hypothetical protein [Anaerolineales bacterium]
MTLRFSKVQRGLMVFSALICAAMPVFFLWAVLAICGIGLPGDLRLLPCGIAAVLVFLGLGFTFVAFLTAIRACNCHSFRLEFLESTFRIRSFTWRGKKESEYRYEDVLTAKRGTVRGELILEIAGSKPLRLTPFLYEGKEKRLLAELERRLPPGRMEPDLGNALTRFRKYDKLLYPVLIAILAGLLLNAGQSMAVDVLRQFGAWRNAVPWDLHTHYRTVSAQDTGDVWFADYTLASEDARIGVIRDGSAQYWNFPAAVFQDDDSSYDILGVWGDPGGNPAVIFESYVAIWDGAEWRTFALPGDVPRYLGYAVYKYSLVYLSAEQDGYRFWSCNLGSIHCDSLPIPDALAEADLQPVSFRGFPSGPVLAAGSGTKPVSFYRFAAGHWAAVGGPLPFSTRFFLGFTVSSEETLWVARDLDLAPGDMRYSSGPLAFGHWDAGAGEWQWSATAEFPGTFEQGVEGMEVDLQGRIWVVGHYRTADIGIGDTAAAYVVRGESAVEVVRYTDEDSNFQIGIGDCAMVQAPDGKLWTCDSGLVSLDAAAEELTPPLPAWLVELGLHKYQMILLGLICGLEVLYFLVVGIVYLKRRKAESANIRG